MPSNKLRAGIGAKGSILTRLIKPLQVVETDTPNERSDVVIERWFANNKGTVYYEFRYLDDEDSSSQLLFAAARYVKIVEEGPEEHIFTGSAPVREAPKQNRKRSWRNSIAKRLLYYDLKDGVVPLEKDDGMTDIGRHHSV